MQGVGILIVEPSAEAIDLSILNERLAFDVFRGKLKQSRLGTSFTAKRTSNAGAARVMLVMYGRHQPRFVQ